MSKRLPLTHLNADQWQRLFDFAALVTLTLFFVYVGAEVYVLHGIDFRGYYAAARVVLDGGNPYDYRAVSNILLEVTGEMGNNPYYYPPWFCLMMVPLALLPFQVARLIWVAILVETYWLGAQISLVVLRWDLTGWGRSLALLSGAYLFFWMSARSEQLGTALLLLAVLSLWAHQRNKHWLAGIALSLLLTKPNVTWLMVPCLGLLYWRRGRRAVWWALATVAVLLVASTLVLPGWYRELARPDFGAGLTMQLDGPYRVESERLNTVLSDWLRPWGISGTLYWVIWGVLALGGGTVMWLSWQNADEDAYWLCLASAVGLLITPYALQYDYPPLVLGLFWIWRALPKAPRALRWAGVAILAFVFSVPIWEQPVYEGYWILLGVLSLLLLLNPRLSQIPFRGWHWPRKATP